MRELGKLLRRLIIRFLIVSCFVYFLLSSYVIWKVLISLATRICIKNKFFKEKPFTTEVQGILKGAWLVRRL
jgi:hypothetical protein